MIIFDLSCKHHDMRVGFSILVSTGADLPESHTQTTHYGVAPYKHFSRKLLAKH